MRLSIKKVVGNKYIGTLDMDDGEVYTSQKHYRPGCVARELLNGLLNKYGQPVLVELDVLEWE